MKKKSNSGFVATTELYRQLETQQEEILRLKKLLIGKRIAPVMHHAKVAEMLIARDYRGELERIGGELQDAFDQVFDGLTDEEVSAYYSEAKNLADALR